MLHFTQYYLDCLSHASYLIGDTTTGRAVVVDPRRDVQEYLDDAAALGLTIELVIETHFHADFLSGHLELAAATGAEIGFGEVAETEFPSRKLRDGERISLGEVTLEVRSTPGHTPESISVVVYEKATDEVPYGVLTGDTLFIGDVGRPDLLGSIGVTADELARKLYDSLHGKLLDLPDATKVFPAHGAGSACGKNLSTETVSTLGEQRTTNYALQDMTPDQFVALVTADQPAAPEYFPYNAVLNRKDRDLLAEEEAPDQMPLADVLARQAEGAVVIDTREPEVYAWGHLRGSINIGISGRFAEYGGTVVSHDTPIILFGDVPAVAEAKLRLGRIGFDQVIGSLVEPDRVLIDNPDLVERASQLTAGELRQRLESAERTQLVDIRNPGEVKLGSIEGAAPIPLAQLRDRLDELDPESPTVVFCAGGYRSSIAASLLEAVGFSDVSDVLGGYGAWMALDENPASVN
jgi:hydroxyacylglutathione hydrolase